jgi:hypothetical protein
VWWETPKALTNSSPGLAQPWVESKKDNATLKALASGASRQRFQRCHQYETFTQGVASSNFGPTLVNAFGVQSHSQYL